jgi:hypothetical protein
MLRANLRQKWLNNLAILSHLSIHSPVTSSENSENQIKRQQFFQVSSQGRKLKDPTQTTQQLIIALRKKFLSVPDIKATLDALNYKVSERYIYNTLEQAGFARLPRRSRQERDDAMLALKLPAPSTQMLTYRPETFSSRQGIGLLCLLPYVQNYDIYSLMEQSQYPETQSINRVSSILSFVALKLSKVRRYSADDLGVYGSRTWFVCWTKCLAQSGLVFLLCPWSDPRHESGFPQKSSWLLARAWAVRGIG